MNGVDVPTRYQGVYKRAMSGRSMKAAIKAHCCMCMGWESKAVKDCTAPDCPLYPYRPGAKKR